MNKFLSSIVSQFGFDNIGDFLSSMFHTKLLFLTLPSAAIIYAFVEHWLGFSPAILLSFVLLAVLELISGLWASRVRKIKIQSKKFGRFGFKLLVWMVLIFVANSFMVSYDGSSRLPDQFKYQIFSWLHGTILVYVSFEYIISIIENASYITGQTNNKLLKFLKKKMDKVLGEDAEQPRKEQQSELEPQIQSNETIQSKDMPNP